MGVLVEDLLTLARLDEVREAEHGAVDLSVLARDAVDDARATDPDREIELHAQPVAVTGDADQLRQVLANLLRNALVHTPAGTPIEVSVDRENGAVRLEVRDHGPGLPTEDSDALFERFWRAEGGRERARTAPARPRDRRGDRRRPRRLGPREQCPGGERRSRCASRPETDARVAEPSTGPEVCVSPITRHNGWALACRPTSVSHASATGRSGGPDQLAAPPAPAREPLLVPERASCSSPGHALRTPDLRAPRQLRGPGRRRTPRDDRRVHGGGGIRRWSVRAPAADVDGDHRACGRRRHARHRRPVRRHQGRLRRLLRDRGGRPRRGDRDRRARARGALRRVCRDPPVRGFLR